MAFRQANRVMPRNDNKLRVDFWRAEEQKLFVLAPGGCREDFEDGDEREDEDDFGVELPFAKRRCAAWPASGTAFALTAGMPNRFHLTPPARHGRHF